MKLFRLLSFLLLICFYVSANPDTTSQASENSEMGASDVCSICLDSFDFKIQDTNDGQYVVGLSCYKTPHRFHKNCIREFIEYKEKSSPKSPKCPMCMKEITEGDQKFIMGTTKETLASRLYRLVAGTHVGSRRVGRHSSADYEGRGGSRGV